MNSFKAKYMELSTISKEAIFLAKFIQDFGLWTNRYVFIYYDNEDNICMVVNSYINSKTKHISIHYYFKQEKIQSSKIILKYVPSLKQVVDIFTKIMKKCLFEKHVAKLNFISYSKALHLKS